MSTLTNIAIYAAITAAATVTLTSATSAYAAEPTPPPATTATQQTPPAPARTYTINSGTINTASVADGKAWARITGGTLTIDTNKQVTLTATTSDPYTGLASTPSTMTPKPAGAYLYTGLGNERQSGPTNDAATDAIAGHGTYSFDTANTALITFTTLAGSVVRFNLYVTPTTT